jgi:alpha-glucosidase
MYFNLTETGLVQVEVWSQELIGNILFGTSMKAIVEEITKVTGRMSSPPDWSQRGAIVGLEGGTDAVTAIVQKLMDGGVPIAGVWLQDWVRLIKCSFY